ncbi:hypothetical protein SRB17_39130 [Streptomyces sp. RB17]|nr:hypothetical protein [Streptomyces sp. RB17]
MHTASMSAMRVVPRMNPSTASKARRATASRVSAVPPGATARRISTARWESRRKKKTSSRASTAIAMDSPTTLTPLMTLDAAVPPNLLSSLRAFTARSSSPVPAAPKCCETPLAALRSEAMIWSPVSMSAATTMYTAPPTTATTATHVSPAATDACTPVRTSRRCNGPSSAVPSRASSTGVTAVRNSPHSRTPTHPTPATSSSTAHQAARRRTGSGNSCTRPADHGRRRVSCRAGPGG